VKACRANATLVIIAVVAILGTVAIVAIVFGRDFRADVAPDRVHFETAPVSAGSHAARRDSSELAKAPAAETPPDANSLKEAVDRTPATHATPPDNSPRPDH
jgi:hypothetical protein